MSSSSRLVVACQCNFPLVQFTSPYPLQGLPSDSICLIQLPSLIYGKPIVKNTPLYVKKPWSSQSFLYYIGSLCVLCGFFFNSYLSTLLVGEKRSCSVAEFVKFFTHFPFNERPYQKNPWRFFHLCIESNCRRIIIPQKERFHVLRSL